MSTGGGRGSGVGLGFRSDFRISRSALGPSTAASRGPAVCPGSASAVLGSASASGVCWGTAMGVTPSWLFAHTHRHTQIHTHRHPVPFPAAAVQLPAQLPGDGLQVHEVAEAPPGALPVEREPEVERGQATARGSHAAH